MVSSRQLHATIVHKGGLYHAGCHTQPLNPDECQPRDICLSPALPWHLIVRLTLGSVPPHLLVVSSHMDSWLHTLFLQMQAKKEMVGIHSLLRQSRSRFIYRHAEPQNGFTPTEDNASLTGVRGQWHFRRKKRRQKENEYSPQPHSIDPHISKSYCDTPIFAIFSWGGH